MAVEYVRPNSIWTSVKPSPYREIGWPVNETFKVIEVQSSGVTFCRLSDPKGFKQQWTVGHERFLDCFTEVHGGHP
jgi:hypothetical protein